MSQPSVKLRNTICQKTCFNTRKAAIKRMKQLNADSERDLKFKSVYFCEEHREWHLTTMPPQAAHIILKKKQEREESKNPSEKEISGRIRYLEGLKKHAFKKPRKAG